MDLPLKFSRAAEGRATHFVIRARAGAVQSRSTPRLCNPVARWQAKATGTPR